MYGHQSEDIVIGIDAANLRGGGGVTHLVELITSAEPLKYGVTKIVIWGVDLVLTKLPDRKWLEKVNPPLLNNGLFARAYWQRFCLSKAASAVKCDVLFVPGGSYAGCYKPNVMMSQNLLPFEWSELWRYGITFMTLKFLLLRLVQSRSFKLADGVIFLTEYAKRKVLCSTGPLKAATTIISHGLSPRFLRCPKHQSSIANYSDINPYRILYVSIIDQYKHQWHVVEAVHLLRVDGLPVVLDLVGPAYPPAYIRLQTNIARFDSEGRWVKYYGAVPYEKLHSLYGRADLGVFASSCENMPIILMENMASGLPVASSDRGPMPEVLGDAGLYFDPEDPASIALTLRKYIDSPDLRRQKSHASYTGSQKYTWTKCADETIGFLAQIARGYQSLS